MKIRVTLERSSLYGLEYEIVTRTVHGYVARNWDGREFWFRESEVAEVQ